MADQQLLAVFAKFFNDRRTSDVVIAIGEHEIYAHSVVLINRSPYFNSMFEGDLTHCDEEFQQSHDSKLGLNKTRIGIKDASYNVISILVEYLYTNTLSPELDLESNLKGLFICANKYQIVSLKTEVQSRIVLTLNAQNVCKELLEYGYQFPSLRKKMLEIFGREFSTISGSPGWSHCFRDFKDDPEIFAEMMISIKHHQATENRAPADTAPANRFPPRPSAVKVESSTSITTPSKTPTAPKWPMVPEFVPLPKSPPSAASFPATPLPLPSGPRPV